MALTAGSRVGPYEIVSSIGAGGMGEVYRARDPRLGRDVAIKVLPDSFSQDSERLRRFEQEARAASALNHPNILTIHDTGVHESAPYVVSELLEGETLRERISRGPMSPTAVAAIGAQVAQGLAAAHAKGIVHRDVKPANLFLTGDDRLKILDFGIARLPAVAADSGSPTHGLTEPGTVLGTVAYMSPEQLRSQPLDGRSDIFSAGVVLYEMLSGRPPFSGPTVADTMTDILREEPAPLPAGIPHALGRIVLRCLAKSPAARFESARSLFEALESAAAAGPEPGGAPRSIAVLLFRDLAGDPGNAHLGLGLADATITELASLKSLVVRPTASVLRYRDRPVDPETAGRELGVDAVVDGNFQRDGSRLRLTVQLVRTEDGKPIWASKIDTRLEDLFRMQDEVSGRIAEALAVELRGSGRDRPRRAARGSGKANELYLQGRLHLSRDTTVAEVNAALECFEGALALEPAFALARLGLADAYTRMDFSIDPEGDWYDRAVDTCREALAIEPDLPEGRYLQARLLWHPRADWDGIGAIREFSAAIAARPNLSEARHFLAQVLSHMGLLEEALVGFQRALAIDPEDEYARVHYALAWYLQGRFEESLGATRAIVAERPTPWSLYQTALCQLHLSRSAEALATLERLGRHFPGSVFLFSGRALIAALDGKRARAREQIALIEKNRKLFGHYHHAQYDAGCAEAILGDASAAIEWLEGASRNGFPCTPAFAADPWLASVRGHPRFESLLADLRVQETATRQALADASDSGTDAARTLESPAT